MWLNGLKITAVFVATAVLAVAGALAYQRPNSAAGTRKLRTQQSSQQSRPAQQAPRRQLFWARTIAIQTAKRKSI